MNSRPRRGQHVEIPTLLKDTHIQFTILLVHNLHLCMRLQQGLRGGREPWTPSPVSGSDSPPHHYGPAECVDMTRCEKCDACDMNVKYGDLEKWDRPRGCFCKHSSNFASRKKQNVKLHQPNCYSEEIAKR